MHTRLAYLFALPLAFGACALDGGDDDDPAPGSGAMCGGFAGQACPADEYCDYDAAEACRVADAAGACRARPTACPEIFAPVRGSDGRTYSNACSAHAAGADDCGPALHATAAARAPAAERCSRTGSDHAPARDL
jgi:hypothetical protein